MQPALPETATADAAAERLEARGLVNRRRSPSDERQVIVSLSEAGRALYAQVQHIPGCMSEALSCSQDDIVALRKQLLTLRDALFPARLSTATPRLARPCGPIF